MTSTATGVAGKTRIRISVLSRFADNDRWLWRAMLTPAILYIVLLVGFPFLLSLYYSVSSVTVASQDMHFVGLDNFRRVVESGTFWLSLQNTIVIKSFPNSSSSCFANILATALVVDFRGRWLVRLLILLPWVAPISLGSIGWLWIFGSIYSVINWTGRAAGLLGPNEWPIWLGQPTLTRASIIIVNVWRILPLATIIVLAGLSSIPRDIHDAAEVDGAGFWRHQFQITMPLILPITLVALLFGIIFTFTDMLVVFVLTRGFCTWLVMGFFKAIPRDLEEAAMIDGLSRFGAFVNVVVPISIAGMLTAVIFAFTLVTQEFVYGVTFITASSSYTVSVGVPTFLVRGDVYFWGSMMAACLIASVPIAIIYNFFVTRFVTDFTMGAIK